MKTVAAIEQALSPRAVQGARRAVARDLVAMLDQDMQYLAWFVAIARAYPETSGQLSWRTAMEVAARCRARLRIAETILRRARPALAIPECDEPRAA